MPRTGSSRKKIAYAALILVSLILAFAIIIVPAMRSTVGPGGTILALNQVSVVSNDAHLNNAKAWLGLFALNGGGQSFVGSWDYTKTEFSNVIDPTTGQLMQPDAFTLSFNGVSQACNYPIASSSNPSLVIYPDLQTQNFGPYWLQSGADTAAQAWCSGIGGLALQGYPLAYGYYNNHQNNLGVYDNYWCITGRTDGEIRSFAPTAYNFTASLTLTTKNGTSSALLSNAVQGVTLYDSNNNPVVYAAWGFNGVATAQCPVAQYNVVPVYDSTSQKWNIASQALYNEWSTDWGNFANQYVLHKTDGQIGSVVTRMQEDVHGLITVKTGDNYFGPASVSSNNKNNAYVSVDTTNNPVIIPVFAIDLNAAWVGIYQPCSQPQVTQIDGSLVGTATLSQTGTATIKNAGPAQSTFSAYLTMPNGVSQMGSIPNFAIPAGQSTKISYTINSAQAVQGTCTLHIQGAGFCSSYQTSKDFWCEFDRYCDKVPTGNFILDRANCVFICPLKPKDGYSIDTANCIYVANQPSPGPNPQPAPQPCSLNCPATYTFNSACSACECALDSAKAPANQFLNATACQYQLNPPQPPMVIDINLVLGVVAILAIFAGAYLWLRRGGRRG